MKFECVFNDIVRHIHSMYFFRGPEWDAKNRYEYVPTHTRFTPWVIGCGLGYLLHYNKSRKLRLTSVCLRL